MRKSFFLFPLVLASCMVGGEMTEYDGGHRDYWGLKPIYEVEETAQEKTESDHVVEAVMAMNEAFRARDVDKLAAYLADDVTTFDPKSGGSVKGKAAVLELVREHWAADPHGAGRNFSVARPSVTFSGDVAIARYALEEQGKEGGPSATVTQMFRKIDGRWMTVHYNETWTGGK